MHKIKNPSLQKNAARYIGVQNWGISGFLLADRIPAEWKPGVTHKSTEQPKKKHS